MSNPISDAAADRAAASPLEGSGLLKDATDLVTKPFSDDLAGGILAGVSAVYEVKEGLEDPLAKLTSMGLGWVIEFFGPLRSVLDWLTGNQEQLNLIVETWSGVAGQMTQTADDLHDAYTTDTAAWSGSAVAQYRLYCADQVDLYRAASATAMSVSNNARMSGMVLTTVREVIRGLITDAVGKAASIISRFPPPTTPGAAPEVTATVVETGNKVRQWLDKLKRAFINAKEMLQESNGLFTKLKHALSTADTYKSAARAAMHDKDVFGEFASRAKDLAVQTAKEVPREIPDAVFEEGVKGAAGAAIGATTGPEMPPERETQEALYDGPGPHRVTGTL
jgi:hypothetical protein